MVGLKTKLAAAKADLQTCENEKYGSALLHS